MNNEEVMNNQRAGNGIVRKLSYCTTVALCLLSFATGCSEEPPTTWQDIKNIKTLSTLDGVGFDVPLNYHYGEYARNIYNWPTISKDVREGKTRQAVDFVNIYALLPELEPVTEENLTAFMELGWGRTIRATITHPRSFEYYFKYTAPTRLIHLQDSPEVPGMQHYQDNITQEEIYLSHDHAVPELIFIRCFPLSKITSSPNCDIETLYRHEIKHSQNGIDSPISTPFYLKYSFSLTYLSQWREIDQKIKALFDQFAQSAAEHP